MAAGCAAGVIVFFHVLLMLAAMSQKNALEKTLSGTFKPGSVPNIRAPIEELRTIDANIKKQVKYITALTADRSYWTVKMAEIARSLPSGLQLNTLTYSEGFDKDGNLGMLVHLEGQAYGGTAVNAVDDVNRFAVALKNSKDFMHGLSEVRIVSVRRAAEQTEFAIDCRNAGKR